MTNGMRASDDEDGEEGGCELSGVGEGSGGEFKRVPKVIVDEAVEAAKAALEDDDEMDL